MRKFYLVEPFCQSLQDDDWNVRLNAAKTLEAIGEPQVVIPLQQALQDPDFKVRKAAKSLTLLA